MPATTISYPSRALSSDDSPRVAAERWDDRRGGRTSRCRSTVLCPCRPLLPSETQFVLNLDFIASVGNKLLLTQAVEAQAGTGHDALHFSQWEIHHHADKLVPMDEAVQRLIAANGKVSGLAEYLARAEGH